MGVAYDKRKDITETETETEMEMETAFQGLVRTQLRMG